MNYSAKKSVLLFLHLLLMVLPMTGVSGQNPTSIKAILFYPPFCAQCSAVIDDFLMPLSMTHGERLELYPVDITAPPGEAIYKEAMQRFGAEADSWDTPSILIGQQLLRGEAAIKAGLPPLIEAELPDKAIQNWPVLRGLQQLRNGGDLNGQTDDKTGNDSLATGLAWTVLFGMICSLVYAALRLAMLDKGLRHAPRIDSLSLPLFSLMGLLIGVYLTSVAMTHSEFMCGPIGDCMAVQASHYSKLFGIPLATWGMGFYLALLVLWAMQRILADHWRLRLSNGLLAFSFFGVMFSVYLTSLELFVIHAVCIWCLTSAVLVTLILLIVIRRLTRVS